MININVQARALIQTAFTIDEIKSFATIDAKTLVVVDVDDTLITPQDNLFRFCEGKNPYRTFIDVLKKEYAPFKGTKTFDEFLDLLGHWRLSRKPLLVENHWPQTLNEWQKLGARTIALTHMDSGSCGPIPSVYQWRLDELASLGFTFSKTKAMRLLMGGDLDLDPYVESGIIFTSFYSKGATLDAYLSSHDEIIERVIFIDDRLDHVESVVESMNARGLNVLGIHYLGYQNIPGEVDVTLAQFQVDFLKEHHRWLDDAQAKKLMEKR